VFLQISIPVSTQTDEWIAAEVLRDEFLHSEKVIDPIETADESDISEATVSLSARFLAFICQRIHEDTESMSPRIAFLLRVFKYFTSSYLSVKDVHSLTATYNPEVRKVVLSSYFQALALLQDQAVVNIPKQPASALFAAAANGNASIFALFGGQGTNEVYFDELQSLYDIYTPFVSEFLTTITSRVLKPLAESQQSTPFYSLGMDVILWLSGASPRPSTAYLASVPISFPLIGLTQLVQYLVVCRVLGFTPGELRNHIAGTTGHSQGIVSAVVIAASTTYESFTENSLKALKWLFFSGFRGQQAFPITSLEPNIVQDAITGGEGAPSPMLSVTGLSLQDLSPHIAKTNSHLPPDSNLHVSLHNGPRAFVICGPARALYGLVTNLRKIRAPSKADQSKVPYSQRKPVFSVRFLVVGVPYHSEHLSGVTENVMSDLKGVELWEAADLGVGVYNTEDGSYLFHLSIKGLKMTLFCRFGFAQDQRLYYPFAV
jgi:fatty acid synthase subunit alpha